MMLNHIFNGVYWSIHTDLCRLTHVWALNLRGKTNSDSDSPQWNSPSPPSSWSTPLWPSSCSLAACSSSRGSQTRWHPDGNPPPCTSWTTGRRPLRGLSMPCSPGRRLDSVTVDWVSIYYSLASLDLFMLNKPGWLPDGPCAPGGVGRATEDVIYYFVVI